MDYDEIICCVVAAGGALLAEFLIYLGDIDKNPTHSLRDIASTFRLVMSGILIVISSGLASYQIVTGHISNWQAAAQLGFTAPLTVRALRSKAQDIGQRQH